MNFLAISYGNNAGKIVDRSFIACSRAQQVKIMFVVVAMCASITVSVVIVAIMISCHYYHKSSVNGYLKTNGKHKFIDIVNFL